MLAILQGSRQFIKTTSESLRKWMIAGNVFFISPPLKSFFPDK